MSKRKLDPLSKQRKRRVRDIKAKVQKGMTLQQIAEELGISRQRVSQLFRSSLKKGEESIAQKRLQHREFWTEGRLALLGVLSDTDIAKRNGVLTSMVSYKRRTLNIPRVFYQSKRGPKPGPRKSLVGRQFGRLKVLKWTRRKDGGIGWICQCRCGNETAPLQTTCLLQGFTTSCGCRKKEMFLAGGPQKWDIRTP